MLTLSFPKEMIQLAGKIGPNLTAEQVLLKKVQLENDLIPGKAPSSGEWKLIHLQGDFEKELTTHGIVYFGCEVHYLAEVKPGERVPVIRLHVVLQAVYRLPEGPVPEEVRARGFPTFARVNGPYFLMPFMRQQIHALTSELPVQPLMLPLLQIVPMPADVQSAKVEVPAPPKAPRKKSAAKKPEAKKSAAKKPAAKKPAAPKA
ncbi:hypothetical protein KKC22_17560 [Myxococcota bacterium]|nr:hypothetical protein [Myxococcota bacterium]